MKTLQQVFSSLTNWMVKNRLFTNSVVYQRQDQFLNTISKKGTRVSKPLDSKEKFQKLVFPLVISGLPGTGKSFLASQIEGHIPRLKVTSIDDFSIDKKGIWTIGDNLPESDVYEGQSEGVVKLLTDKKASLVIPIQTWSNFKSIMHVRAIEDDRSGLTPSFAKSMVDVSESKYWRMIYDSIRFWLDRVPRDTDVYLVTLDNSKSKIRKGDHSYVMSTYPIDENWNKHQIQD
jgi:hypothetical protein